MTAAQPGFLRSRTEAAMRNGGPRAVLREAVSYLRARWLLRHASAAGHARAWGQIRVHNRGHMVIGDRVRIGGPILPVELTCHEGATLTIGDGTYINYGVDISATRSVRIGRECAIGQYTIIIDNDYHQPESHWQLGVPTPVVIEDGVWIGARVVVLRGAHIGAGAVIGANSVVRGVIPPHTVAAGVPARVVRVLRRGEAK